ncbi:hypothetical protein B0H17DRAFT_1139676 [Mycena rosella]|uniref:Uncharacterized protein n=1 Tax=Mycena rosella TaxID=1033263 RepID=A0AAD7D4Y8_MYCRO|nr:hypothetical protein B0H17DRAFT_1139676 [Mycena rosella]
MASAGIWTRSGYDGSWSNASAANRGDNKDTSFRGVHDNPYDVEDEPFVNTLFVEDLGDSKTEDAQLLEELRSKSPSQFAEYLTEVAKAQNSKRETASTASVWGVSLDDYSLAGDGSLQPEITLADDPSIHARLTDPRNPKRVAEIWKQITVGTDLTPDTGGKGQGT